MMDPVTSAFVLLVLGGCALLLLPIALYILARLAPLVLAFFVALVLFRACF